MNRTELQTVGNEILETQIKLLQDNRAEWEVGKYSIAKSYEDAIKEICLLK